MGFIVTTLFVLIGVILLLILLAPVTRRYREELEAYEVAAANAEASGTRESAAAAEPAAEAAESAVITSLLDPIPSESFAEQVRKVLSTEFLFGCFMFALLLIFFPMNARILAEGFEILFDRAGTAIAILTIGGWQWQITDLQVYGIALTLALIILGGFCSMLFENGAPLRWPLFFGLLCPAIALEVSLAVRRGVQLAAESGVSPLFLGAWSGVQAWVCAATEVAGGHIGIPRAVIPSLQIIGWTVVAPFRLMGRVLRTASHLLPTIRVVEPEPHRPGFFARLAAYFDESIMDPLRALDKRMTAILASIRDALAARATTVLSRKKVDRV